MRWFHDDSDMTFLEITMKQFFFSYNKESNSLGFILILFAKEGSKVYWPGVYWPSRKVSLTIHWTAVVQSLSCVHGCQALQASLSFTIFLSLLKPMPSESLMLSNHLILYQPLLLLPSIFPSIRVFSNEAVLRLMWPKFWSFNFSINSSKEYSGLISFSIDWLDLLAVQGTLKSAQWISYSQIKYTLEMVQPLYPSLSFNCVYCGALCLTFWDA